MSRAVESIEVQPGTGPLTYGWRQDTWVDGDDADPGPVRAGAVATTSLARAGWAVSATADTLLTVDAGSLHLAIDLACTHDGEPVWSDRVERVIPRRWT